MEIDKLIKQDKFQGEYHKAYINLIYTANHFRDINTELFRSFKIQPQHFNLLRILTGNHPEPVTPGYIKEVMLDKGNDITRLIYKLEKLGWVTRQGCQENKRNININITDDGLEVVEKINLLLDRSTELHRHLTEEESRVLSQLLDKMRG